MNVDEAIRAVAEGVQQSRSDAVGAFGYRLGALQAALEVIRGHYTSTPVGPESPQLLKSLNALGYFSTDAPNNRTPRGGVTAMATWPSGAAPGGSYVVRRPEGVMTDLNLDIVLPDNFTLEVAADVPFINWRVNSLSFGVNCTLVLDADQAKPNAPAPPSAVPGQPGLFQDGAPGYGGAQGASGKPGRPFDLVLQSVGMTGSLWIRTNGGPAADGGQGGRGQLGGGTTCRRHYHPPNGGPGGVGGQGGIGGNTSEVTITVLSLPSG